MDLSNCSISELVSLYSQSVKELKKRGVLRTKNVVGELGEYLVLEQYEKNPNLPNLNMVPVGTKNINAISQAGDRYSIKSTSGNVTGVIYGLQPPESSVPDKPLFEYMVICKLDSDCGLEGIYQLSWDDFLKHKKWHSRMNAWNVTLTKAMKEDAVVIYEKDSVSEYKAITNDHFDKCDMETDEADIESVSAITWNKTEKVSHTLVRDAVAKRLTTLLKCDFHKTSQSRYISGDNESALFVLSANYSQKNGEYWYSINDENIPWMELYPKCYIAFALGSSSQVLVFEFSRFRKMLDGCLRTKEEPEKKKKAHYHFSFAVEGSRVFFKKKIPLKEFIEVTDCLK